MIPNLEQNRLGGLLDKFQLAVNGQKSEEARLTMYKIMYQMRKNNLAINVNVLTEHVKCGFCSDLKNIAEMVDPSCGLHFYCKDCFKQFLDFSVQGDMMKALEESNLCYNCAEPTKVTRATLSRVFKREFQLAENMFNEKIVAQLQKERQAEFDEFSQKMCDVCAETYHLDKFQTLDCGHRFCWVCMKDYIMN